VFISVNQFEREMGVHQTIGRFFVDRQPPKENSFWQGKLLYVGNGNGYVSIPVYYDLLRRLGVPVEFLLREEHVRLMEQLMHYAVLQERNIISKKEELENTRKLLTGRVLDHSLYESLNRYLDQPILKPLMPFGLEHASLNRADVFLFVLCDLPLNEIQQSQAIRYWYALHPNYLIMDDIRDYTKDLEEREENVVIENGAGAPGFEKTFGLFRKNAEILGEINPTLSRFMLEYEEDLREFVPKNI